MGLKILKRVKDFFKEENSVSFFSQKRDKSIVRAKRNLKLTFVLLIAWMIFDFVSKTLFFESLKDVLQPITLLLFFLLASVFALVIGCELVTCVVRSFKRRVFPIEISLLFALLLTFSSVVFSLLQEKNNNLPFCEFIVLLFIIAFDREISLSFKRDLQKVAGAESFFQTREVKRIQIAPEDPLAGEQKLKLDLGEGKRSLELVHLSDLKVGDLIQVSERNVVPADCIVKSGWAIYRSQIFGSWGMYKVAFPRMHLSAGAVLTSGTLTCEVENISSEYKEFLAKLTESQLANNDKCVSHALLFNVVLFVVAVAVAILRVLDSSSGSEIADFQRINDTLLAVFLVAISFRSLTFYPLCRAVVLASNFMRGIYIDSLLAIKKLAQTKEVLLDFSSECGSRQVVDFQIVDSRIDEKNLIGVLLSLFSCSERYEVVIDYLAKRYPQVELFEVSDLRTYSDKGFAGKIEGSTFFVGGEPFLVEQGVHLQANDASGAKFSDSEFVLIALGHDLIAKIELSPVFIEDGRELKQALDAMGLKVALAGDKIENRIVEYTGMAKTELDCVTESEVGVLSYLSSKSDLNFWKNRAEIKSMYLPEDNSEGVDIFFFNRDLMGIVKAIQSARNFVKIIKLSRCIGVLFVVTLLGLASFSIISPIFCGGLALLGSIIEYILLAKLRA